MNTSQWYQQIKQLPCTVIGLGISNLPLIDFLLSHGARVYARDRKTREELADVAQTLEQRGVTLQLGENYLEDLAVGLIFRSPGIRPDLPQIKEALKKGAILTSEMELFLELTPARVLAITGSDGKTTTTTLTGLFLSKACAVNHTGRVYVGGNIGTPLLPHVEEMTSADFAVLELSSFQLQTMRFSPRLSAITNLSPNHLNWHTDMEEYTRAKANICYHTADGRLVTNAENEITARLAKGCASPKTYFSSVKQRHTEFSLAPKDHAVYERNGTVFLWNGEAEQAILETSDILLPGKHNLENYMTSIGLTEGLVPVQAIQEVAKTFTGVPHRLERVRIHEGVTYYNSSIDSSPSRTAAAISALQESPIVICGGYDKNIPFAPLAKVLCERAKAVVLTGATAEKIRLALEEHPEVRDGILPVYMQPDFKEAILLARRIASSGDTVLLSPACASFDAFRNFEERGNVFRQIVQAF